jgi:ABC-2 type transport system ATP-binding protein
MIQVEGVTKKYGPHTAVHNISFEVGRGEIVGFLGPNGAGKTTTMRMLTGFLPPTEGRAIVAGFDVMEQPLEAKRRTGYLPENPPVYPEMEVEDYLDFVARIKGIKGPEIQTRIDSVMERTAIAHVRDKIIGKLSKGYRQRVGLAQALIHSPEVLILDEPTVGLDPKQIIEIRELVRSLAGEHTIMLSTHILSEVASTCHRIIIINKGQIEASDTPENLTARLQGGESTQLEISGPREQVEARLTSIPGVEHVTYKAANGGRGLYDVATPRTDDIRTELAKAVVESGWGLYAMKSVGLSLEDIFLQLTAAEGADEAQLAAAAAEREAAAAAASGSEENQQ